jgi:hypothetical protein
VILAGALVGGLALAAAASASAEAPPTGWYAQAGKGDGVRASIYARGTRLRVATLTGGRGRCVDARGRRRSVGGAMDFAAWTVTLAPDGSFKASNRGPARLPSNRKGNKDRFRQWIKGKVVGARIVGTYRKRSFYSAEGRDRSQYPERCRGRNAFDARLVWAHGARYAGLTSQGRPVEIVAGTPQEHPNGPGSPPHAIGPGSILSLKKLREAPIRVLRTSARLTCRLTGTTVDRTIEVGPMANPDPEGMRGFLVFGGTNPYGGSSFFFDGGPDQITVSGLVDGLQATGTLGITHRFYNDVPPYFGDECSADVTFTGAHPPAAPGAQVPWQDAGTGTAAAR